MCRVLPKSVLPDVLCQHYICRDTAHDDKFDMVLTFEE
eukprot:SAG11_NODE_7990_length_1072_cov_1.647482_1_plen_37_part_10